jgi:hypothetical protein
MFSILPQGSEEKNQLPKITFGGYQREQITLEEQQYFYKENLNTIVAHRVSGSFHWELDVNTVKIGEYSMRPTVRSVLTDTGTSMVMIYRNDLKVIHEMLCKFIDESGRGAKCSKIGYGYLQINGCSDEIQA